MGPLLTDSYNTSYNLGVAGNYYFSEREGVEAHYWSTVGSESDLVSYFKGRYGTIPDYNLTRAYFGLAYNYVPIYAKLSWLGKKILYFDMSVSPGLGVTQLESISIAGASGTSAPSTKQMPITLALDVAQQLFLSEYLALRVDLRNHIFQEAVYGAATQAQVRTKVTYQGSITFGVTFFLGSGQTPVQAK
jgi:outer membrane beta-barrel protein